MYCSKEQNNNNTYFERGRECFKKSLEGLNGGNEVPFTDKILIQELRDIWKKPSEPPYTSNKVHYSQGSTESTTSNFLAPTKADCQCFLTGNCRGEERSSRTDILLYERSSCNADVANPISLMEIGLKKGKYDFWQKVAQGDTYTGMMRDPTENRTQNDNGIKSYKLCNPMLLSCIIIGKDVGPQTFCADFAIFLCIPAYMFFCGESVSTQGIIVLRKLRKLLVK